MPRETLLSAASELMTLPALAKSHQAVEPAGIKVSVLEASWYMRSQLLRDSDWASMAHGLELRVPLVDWPLWRTVAHAGDLARNRQASDGQNPRAPLARFAPESTKGWVQYAGCAVAKGSAGSEPRRPTPPGLRDWAARVWERWFETVAG